MIVKTASHQMLQKFEWRQLALEVLLHFVGKAVEAGIRAYIPMKESENPSFDRVSFEIIKFHLEFCVEKFTPSEKNNFHFFRTKSRVFTFSGQL